MVGNQPFVSSELQRFMVNNQDLPMGHQIHSPLHNRVDSIRDESVYNVLNKASRPPSSSQYSMSASSGFSKLKLKLQQQTHGLTSEKLAAVYDSQAKANGGEMAACINYEYEKDYILEALMNDKMLQAKKQRKKSFDVRKTTKAHEGNMLAAKKRIAQIKEKEMSDRRTTLKRHTQPNLPVYVQKALDNSLQEIEMNSNRLNQFETLEEAEMARILAVLDEP